MKLKAITNRQKSNYNKLVSHLMQSWEWGELRQKLGTKLLRFGLYQNGKLQEVFQLTLHKIPFTNSVVGYLPKGPYPSGELAETLRKIGEKYHCAFIKVEPNILNSELGIRNLGLEKDFKRSPKPMFTKYNYVLNLTQSEETLLQKMHPKTRYNIKVAQKHGVKVEERTDDEAFEIYLKLHFDTTKRQGFYSHTPYYHRQVWQEMKKSKMARLLIAFYPHPETKEKIPLNVWMLLNFKDTLYYPYGGSSTEYKNVMAPILTAWEAIKLGKKLKLKKFDLWGAGDPQKGTTDSYFGFTQFKSRLGAELEEYIGTYDLVLSWPVYWLFTFIDKLTPLKIFLLKILRKN